MGTIDIIFLTTLVIFGAVMLGNFIQLERKMRRRHCGQSGHIYGGRRCLFCGHELESKPVKRIMPIRASIVFLDGNEHGT